MLAISLLIAGSAAAQSGDGSFASPSRFQERDGAAIYLHICQGCHMAGGKGAVGAGAFPTLAGDQKLDQAGYPVLVVLNGLHGMPGFAGTLNDAQIAAVVTYVRTHFGNAFGPDVTGDDVHAARQ
jgi:mono/diheme cytochrome c family protein